MKQILFRVSAWSMVVLGLAGCQHIAPEPLNLEVIPVQLGERLEAIDPALAYAQSLTDSGRQHHGPFNLDDGLSLDEAHVVALWYNSDARLARLEAEQSLERIAHSGRVADPSLRFDFGKKEVEEGGLLERSLIRNGSLSITIPLSGRRGASKQMANSEAALALAQVRAVEWQVSRDLQGAWLQWSVLLEELTLLEGHIQEVAKFSAMAEQLGEAGELNPVNARFFSIGLHRLEAERVQLQAAAEEAQLALFALMGLAADAPVTLLPQIQIAEPIGEEKVDLSFSHPELAQSVAAYRVTEDALALELRKQYPDLVLSPTFSDEESERALVLGMGFPVPVWNGNRLGIVDAVATRERAGLEVEHRYHKLSVALAQWRSRHTGATARWAHLNTKAAPAQDAQLRQAQTLMRVGELDAMLLNEVLKQSIAIKRDMLRTFEAQEAAQIHIQASTVPHAPLDAGDVKHD